MSPQNNNKGQAPFLASTGYKNDKYGVKGYRKILIDEDNFEKLKLLWKLLLAGSYSLNQLLDKEFKLHLNRFEPSQTCIDNKKSTISDACNSIWLHKKNGIRTIVNSCKGGIREFKGSSKFSSWYDELTLFKKR